MPGRRPYSCDTAFSPGDTGTCKSSGRIERLKDDSIEHLGVLPDEDVPLVKYYFGELQYHYVRDMILNQKIRLDVRGLEDVRPLTMETDILPSPHGSALFTRGETQSL